MQQLPSPSGDPTAYLPVGRQTLYAGPLPPTRPEPADSLEDDIAAQYWRRLWNAKWIVVGCTALGIALGGIATLFQTPVYRSRTTLELQMINPGYLDIKGLDPGAGNDSLETFMQTQVSLLQSEALLDRTIHKLKQATPKTLSIPPASGLRARLGLGAGREETIDQALMFAIKNLSVKGSGLTRLVDVTCDSPHPEFAAAFATTLVNEFMEQNLENRWDSTRRTGEWLVKKVDELKGKLQTAEENLQAYSRAAGLIYTSERDVAAEERLRRLEGELSTVRVERMQKQSRYEQALHSPPDSVPEVQESGEIREYQSRLLDLRRQVAEATTTMKAEHPKVERLQAQINEVAGEFTRKRENVIRRLRNEFEATVRRERMLEEAHSAAKNTVSSQMAKSTRYTLLKREVDSTRQMYDSMLQKLKEVGVASAMPLSNVRVINPAKVPVAPALPSKTLNAALGLVGGALLGLVVGTLRKGDDNRLKLPGEASSLLGVPEIGLVPALRHDPYSRAGMFSRFRSEKPNGNGLLQPVLRTDSAIDLTLVGRADSLMAEAYRGTLPAILFANEQHQLNTLVVSSANPGEGKTSLIANLAVGLAEMKKRVLLIDADVLNARLHDVFGIPRGPGLSELLDGAGSDAAPVATKVKGLSLLPAGEPSPQTRNLLYSARMSQVLSSMKGRYDLVLVDTAPVLYMRDARLVGRLADAVLLVVRAGQTSRDAAAAAAARFRDDGTPLLGVVLNDWNPKECPTLYGTAYLNGYRRYQNK